MYFPTSIIWKFNLAQFLGQIEPFHSFHALIDSEFMVDYYSSLPWRTSDHSRVREASPYQNGWIFGKVPLSPLYFQDSRKIFLSLLDFQDCGDQFLCILSIFKIFSLNILIINNFPLRKPTRSCFGPILKSIWNMRIRRQ